ncbi:hypothetical protein GOP47_0024003, partial [Adiantum capillus-veneris]
PSIHGRGRRGRRLSTTQASSILESSDQISAVFITDMTEGLETREEEMKSQDLRLGSIKEVDEYLAPQEACLQIVPYVRDEVVVDTETVDKHKLYMHRGQGILQCTWMFSCFDCPPIPFCRLIPYARVRGLRDDVSGLKSAFAKERYMKEKRAFIVSIWNCKKEESYVTVIDPTQVPEIAVLSSLQRMNFMNTHALVVTHLRDELVNYSHICAADHEAYVTGLPEKDQKLIAVVLKKYSKGVEPWYPLTHRYLVNLLYDVQMSKESCQRIQQARHTMTNEELIKEEEKILNDLALKYGEHME